jgi:hypothetical protein
MNLFKRKISKRGINTIEVCKEEGATKIFNFEPNKRSIERKFMTFRHTTGGATQIEITNDIARCRDEIFQAYRFEKSVHQSGSSVYGDLHVPTLIKTPKTRQKLWIKSASKLCRRTIQSGTEKLIQILTNQYGEQYAEFYLNTAVKK